MKIKLLFLASVLFTTLYGSSIKGAGSTLAAPLIYSFAYYYYEDTNIDIHYQSIGSFAGIDMLKRGSIDFVSSDKPLDESQLQQYGFIQFPLLEATIDIVHNIKDIKDNELKISNQIVAEIFLGNIQYWDDPKILKTNPNLQLSHKKINIITRKGKSGTSYCFTKFLDANSNNWSQKIGVVKELKLQNSYYNTRGNEGVSNKLVTTPFSIGYIPSPYAKAHKLSRILIQDDQKKWISSNNQKYPIRITNFAVVSKKDFQNNSTLTGFFKWVSRQNHTIVEKLGYIPIKQ